MIKKYCEIIAIYLSLSDDKGSIEAIICEQLFKVNSQIDPNMGR